MLYIGYGIFLLSGAFALTAFITALAAHCKAAFWRKFWPIALVVFQVFGFAALVISGAYLLRENLQPKWFFWYGLSLLVAFGAGAILILRHGMRLVEPSQSAAVHWSRWKPAFAFCFFFALHILMLDVMQLAVMTELNRVSADAAANVVHRIPPTPLDAHNARLVYEKAIRALPAADSLPDWFHGSAMQVSHPPEKEVGRFLSEHGALLATIEKAAAIPAYRLAFDSLDYAEWPIPDFRGYRTLAVLVTMDSRVKADSGDAAGALKALAVMGNMSEHLASVPLLVSFVVAARIDEMRIRGFEYFLSRIENLQGDFVAPAQPPPKSSPLVALQKALHMEAQGQLAGFAKTASAPDIRSVDSPSATAGVSVTPATKMWRAFFLPSELRAARDIFTAGLMKPASTYAELRKNLEVMASAREQGRLGILTAISGPDYANYVETAIRWDALKALEGAATAAAQYRAVNGRYPDQLEALMPRFMEAIPSSPYTGAPLQMSPGKEGLALCCPSTELPAAGQDRDNLCFVLGKKRR
jgi:Tfp pilus assembly protein PilE/cytochrome b561